MFYCLVVNGGGRDIDVSKEAINCLFSGTDWKQDENVFSFKCALNGMSNVLCNYCLQQSNMQPDKKRRLEMNTVRSHYFRPKNRFLQVAWYISRLKSDCKIIIIGRILYYIFIEFYIIFYIISILYVGLPFYLKECWVLKTENSSVGYFIALFF